MQLTTPKQIRQALTINKEQYNYFIEEGMPYLHIGDKIRFDKTEVIEWFQAYIMRQELLEIALPLDAVHKAKIQPFTELSSESYASIAPP